MSITRDEEPLAVALWVERNHGDRGALFIAEQIGALALEGDAAGMERWKAVAAAWQRLRAGPVQ